MASFGVFDDDESESGTWAQPLDSDVNAPRLPLRLDGEEEEGRRRRPTTRYAAARSGRAAAVACARRRIESQAAGAASDHRPSGWADAVGAPLRSRGAVARAELVASVVVAEQRRDHAQQLVCAPRRRLGVSTAARAAVRESGRLLPQARLDKPLLDTTAVPESPMVSSPRSEAAAAGSMASSPPTAPQQAMSHRSRLKRSIRLVAQDRKRFLDRAGKRAPRRTPREQRIGASAQHQAVGHACVWWR